MSKTVLALMVGAVVCSAGALSRPCMAGEQAGGRDQEPFPAMDQVITPEYRRVVSTASGESMWDLYINDETGSAMALLPKGYESAMYFLAPTMSGGIPGANSSTIDGYAVTFKRHDKSLLLIQPNLDVRTTGGIESKLSQQMQFTDRMVAELPIRAMSEGRPLIDLSGLLVRKGKQLFPMLPELNARVVEVTTAKAFPKNVELAFKAPGQDGTLITVHHSLSELPEKPRYTPRSADYRVGYFTTTFTDLNSVGDRDLTTRYICRWHLEKANAELRMSPPREPIVFYIEHTTPVRYRQAVREGILEWNKAFERVGIVDAIEVYQQDAESGAHMEKDPEDVRYNFARWSSNNLGFAIGPLRADPRTGQILDADMLMNDGWLRVAVYLDDSILESMATELLDPETLSWLDSRPDWDPRILLASPARRPQLVAERERMLAASGPRPHGGHPVSVAIENAENRRAIGGLRRGPGGCGAHALCRHADHRFADISMASLFLADRGGPDTQDRDLDGVPDAFVNALIKDIMMHEVGHVLGLRHNFSGSSLYDIEEINSPAMKGKAFTSTVMDYNAANFSHGVGRVQGDYFMPTLGLYDYWAIRYGYETDESKLDGILRESTLPEHTYHGDEHIYGPDPRVRLRDMGKNVLDFVRMQHGMLQEKRGRIVAETRARGGSWERARFAMNITIMFQMRDVMTAANWLGGTYTFTDRAGTADRAPLQPVDAATQREALRIVIDHTFRDEAYGLNRELLTHIGAERWLDLGERAFVRDETVSVHDVIEGLQGTALTLTLNPTTLRRIYDNEFVAEPGEDVFTLAEMMDTIRDSVWSELEVDPPARRTGKSHRPWVSSTRRNLQSMHVDRLIDLSLPKALPGAAAKPIADLARQQLREIRAEIAGALDEGSVPIDRYTAVHLAGVGHRIDAALEAQYTVNRDDI